MLGIKTGDSEILYQSEMEQHLSIHAVLFMDLISSYPLLCCYVFYVVNIDFFSHLLPPLSILVLTIYQRPLPFT